MKSYSPSREGSIPEHYESAPHRSDSTPFAEVQGANQAWWTARTMSYDWTSPVGAERYSREWYDEIDCRFIQHSRLFAHRDAPFDRMIPFPQLHGMNVLEVGCGMGFHTELLVKAGAHVTAIDLSETSVRATQRRLALKALRAEVLQHDAERLPFADGQFNYVWSWGVIHHSSRTMKCVREISRVLQRDGECGIMVYNRDGAAAWRALVKHHWLLLGAFRGHSVDEALNRGTDGFHARHYTKDQIEDAFRAFFENVEARICGQVPDALPVPRLVRRLIEPLVSERWLARMQAKRGSFIFVRAERPV